jgi:acyl carrier protein
MPMPPAEIYSTLQGIFQDVFDRDDLVLTPEMSAADVAGWDSFKQIEIIIGVEQAYGVTLQSKEIDGLNTVGDLARLLETKAGNS